MIKNFQIFLNTLMSLCIAMAPISALSEEIKVDLPEVKQTYLSNKTNVSTEYTYADNGKINSAIYTSQLPNGESIEVEVTGYKSVEDYLLKHPYAQVNSQNHQVTRTILSSGGSQEEPWEIKMRSVLQQNNVGPTVIKMPKVKKRAFLFKPKSNSGNMSGVTSVRDQTFYETAEDSFGLKQSKSFKQNFESFKHSRAGEFWEKWNNFTFTTIRLGAYGYFFIGNYLQDMPWQPALAAGGIPALAGAFIMIFISPYNNFFKYQGWGSFIESNRIKNEMGEDLQSSIGERLAKYFVIEFVVLGAMLVTLSSMRPAYPEIMQSGAIMSFFKFLMVCVLATYQQGIPDILWSDIFGDMEEKLKKKFEKKKEILANKLERTRAKFKAKMENKSGFPSMSARAFYDIRENNYGVKQSESLSKVYTKDLSYLIIRSRVVNLVIAVFTNFFIANAMGVNFWSNAAYMSLTGMPAAIWYAQRKGALRRGQQYIKQFALNITKQFEGMQAGKVIHIPNPYITLENLLVGDYASAKCASVFSF